MRLGELSADVRDLLATAELTYHEVGATAGDLPAGYHQFTRSVPIGRGREVFAAAGDAVCRWRVQLGAGLQVSASAPSAIAGAVVILGLGIGPFRLRAPCRVVYAVDEPRRRGFAYGTLAGHPESGEEAFMIQRHDDEAVSFTITAFSRPATRLAKVAGPADGVVQRQITARYLRALGKVIGLPRPPDYRPRAGTGNFGDRQTRGSGGQARQPRSGWSMYAWRVSSISPWCRRRASRRVVARFMPRIQPQPMPNPGTCCVVDLSACRQSPQVVGGAVVVPLQDLCARCRAFVLHSEH